MTASAFEAFGNYLYGMLGILGGITEAELHAAAGWTQSGNDGWDFWYKGDSAEDRSHVAAGIAAGKAFLNGNPMTNPEIFAIIQAACS